MNQQVATSRASDPAWRALYIAGGIAAMVAVLVFRRYLSVELMQFKGFGLFSVPDAWPADAAGWFAVFQENRFAGLLLFDFLDLVNYALVGLIFLALYGALRDVSKSSMLVATVFGFVGIAVYFAANQSLAMLNLSDRFAMASSETEQAMFLAAGEALLAIHNHGTGIRMSLFLVLLAGLIMSIVMLRSGIFNKATAIAGILANGLAIGYFFALPLRPFGTGFNCWKRTRPHLGQIHLRCL